ncbi:histidine phosphatase family protein [Paenibacillus puldeungensis]|uniref:histidine phosphatase family protein n=1 Tax=Paenibacillus puldeungensis TaxID=696536 RepID=UPI0036D22B70
MLRRGSLVLVSLFVLLFAVTNCIRAEAGDSLTGRTNQAAKASAPALVGLPASTLVPASAPLSPSVPAPSSLLESLRQGGYILYIRHGEATVGEDKPTLVLDDCSTQRNLSPEGRRQATALGETLRRLQIPIHDPVEASPLCRTRETAALAFGAPHVQTNPFWLQIYALGGGSVTPAQQEAALSGLTAMLERIPPSGTNRVIVAHSFPSGIGLGDIPNAGIVVVKPGGENQGYEIAGRLSLTELMN